MSSKGLEQRIKSTLKAQQKSLEKFGHRLVGDRVCIGVTGLSKAGKTSFVTSLIYQLMNPQHALLPSFTPALKGQLLGAKLCSASGDFVDFNYDASLNSLSQIPASWPKATSALSHIELELRYKRSRRGLFNLGSDTQSLILEIRDYPGEWLLDLPMLGLDFQQWSQHQFEQASSEQRCKFSSSIISKLSALDLSSDFEPELADDLMREYQQYLLHCQDQGLVMLQPGRLLMPERDKQWLAFFPGQLDPNIRYASTSWASVLEQRYKAYLKQVVQPFYQDVFSGVDRQIVLVDILASLSGGPGVFEDTRQALTAVLESFNYGKNSLLSRWFSPRIERLLIAATKIDQVLPEQHENVRSLVAQLTAKAYREAKFESIEFQCEAFAAIRASSIEPYQGKSMLKGVVEGGGAALLSHPQIPSHLPETEQWQELLNWKPKRLLPPPGLKLDQGKSLPHIRMDTIIRELIGDRF
ncbi:YcjX family protein [Alginatibacterium sediminis]|uniref:YcjX family protein n=1 Tax=Alginatibacterium sediminis TaxID=2164068 RepID=A0A420ECQ9_9ALTE|nr:YcjX family protein [Alginatibacterium sediminis]RKF18470.1 YcjX family protein [Alginatibacterium sediminis]